MSELHYKEVPLTQLRIEEVHWSDERAQHIRTRSRRKSAAEFDVEPEWATEAVVDPNRLVAVSGSDLRTQSLKVIGYSHGANRILKVWIWCDEPLVSTAWNGGSAVEANDTDKRRYLSAREGESDD